MMQEAPGVRSKLTHSILARLTKRWGEKEGRDMRNMKFTQIHIGPNSVGVCTEFKRRGYGNKSRKKISIKGN